MVKAKLTDNTMILGLSAINIVKLKEGMPIVFDARQMGYAGKICIMYGETEEAIADELMQHTGGIQT